MTNNYAVRFRNGKHRFYATKEAAERAMTRSDYAILWHWADGKWKQLAMRAVLHADASKDAEELR